MKALVTITPAVAQAIAWDAAGRHARKHGRGVKWTREDSVLAERHMESIRDATPNSVQQAVEAAERESA